MPNVTAPHSCSHLSNGLAFGKDLATGTKRGPHRGEYCMSRFGDRGPFKLGNVCICLGNANNRERTRGNKNLFEVPKS